MKKNKNIEMRIYELLGIKTFRKIAFILRDILNFPLTIKMTKEERKDFLYNTASNYNIGRINSLEDIKKFKKQLFINAGVHLLTLSARLPNFLNIIDGTASLSTTIINLAFLAIPLYCIMLQRYNCIRINKLIKKMTLRYEKQKGAINEELRKGASLPKNHPYKIVDKKRRKPTINLEDLIATATIEQLKQYREHLAYFQSINQNTQENEFYYDKSQIDISVPIEKHKSLKLELKNINNNF